MMTPALDTTGADSAVSGYAAGCIDGIPVRNIWLLLLYASRLYRELPEWRRVAVEEAPDDIPNLVAEILTRAVERRLRRNLSRDYRRRRDDLNRVRGRINLLRTERRLLLQRGRIACVFDELTVDTPRNRYVKAALRHLGRMLGAREGERERDLAHRCRVLAGNLERAGVADPVYHRGRPEVPPLREARADADDRQMLAAAQLAFELDIPTVDAGRSTLAMPDKVRGWELFEKAIAGFYDVTLSPQGWRVRHSKPLSWPKDAETAGIGNILPGMITDVVLEHQAIERRIVIDTKYTSVVTRGQYDSQRLRSGHIYQIYAYLRSQEKPADPLSYRADGILLYPAIDCSVDEAAVIQGHTIRFATVDLADSGPALRQRLLDIAQSTPLSD